MSKEFVEFEINDDQLEYLKKVADDQSLPDVNKALRVLLDYAMQDGDADEIFGAVRCRHC